MNIPPNDSKIWIALRMASMLLVLWMCFHYNYNTFDPVKDPRAMLLISMGLLGFDAFKAGFAPKPTEL